MGSSLSLRAPTSTTTMEEIGLVLMSVTMFLGSYVAGFLPLYFTLNERRIRLASIFGAGLLVGTALSVIIPEGVSTLHKSVIAAPSISIDHPPPPLPPPLPLKAEKPINAPPKEEQQLPHLPLFNNMLLNPNPNHKQTLNQKQKDKAHERSNDDLPRPPNEEQAQKEMANNRPRMIIKRDAIPHLEEQKLAHADISSSDTHNHAREEDPSLNWAIGISLTAGFLFMFIIDQLSKSNSSQSVVGIRSTRSVPTLGLIIHAAADGIAMGSASASSELDLQLLVFLAIMLHKGPTAFALVSFLMLEGLERSRIRKHLFIFSAAAPIAALITYTLLHSMNAKALGSPYVTGEILLFSGGTFLFIAVGHVLPELDSKCSSTGGGGGRGHFSTWEMILFVISALFPAFISAHSHGHGH